MREDISSLKISLIGGGGEGSNLLMNSSLNIPVFFLKSSLNINFNRTPTNFEYRLS